VRKIEPYLLSLAGEYRVCTELNKRGIFATVTYGNRKSVDVYAINSGSGRAVRIEVKTSQRDRLVTSIGQKGLATDPTAAQFWVLCQLRPMGADSFEETFFVLTHSEICAVQAARNEAYAAHCRSSHGKPPDLLRGVDNVGSLTWKHTRASGPRSSIASRGRRDKALHLTRARWRGRRALAGERQCWADQARRRMREGSRIGR
jgi:hypothetical protein